jgi:hypothetical protein
LKKPKKHGPAQDYLIFHPARTAFQASGTASVAGQAGEWAGQLWADRTTPEGTGNEDPFIWTDFWLYSYCHATQLRRKTQSLPYVQRGSRLFFCEAAAAKKGLLAVDTVFKVAYDLPWEPPGHIPDAFLYLDEESPEWRRHLRHGTELPGSDGAHVGRFTYVAEMAGASLLPLGADGHPVSTSAVAVSRRLRATVLSANPDGRGSYPVPIDVGEADSLYETLRRSHTCVIAVDPDGYPIEV